MLDLAIRHQEAVREKLSEIAFDEEYMYLFSSSYRDDIEIEANTWNKHHFVSLNDKGEVIGYFKYGIDRDALGCYGLQIVNFKKDTLSKCFGKDLEQLFKDIFFKFKFNKLKFGVIVGNPAESFYDKYIDAMGGRIVGIHNQDCKLLDGNLYDFKEYEILRENFINKFNKSYLQR